MKTINGICLDSFTLAFCETLLWSTNDESDEHGGEPLDRNYSIYDFSPEALEKIKKDCERFQNENHETIFDAISTGDVVCGPDFNELERAGHDFFLTRCGHGAGFWDGDWPEPYAQKLTDAAHAFGEIWAYVGDDGKIYI